MDFQALGITLRLAALTTALLLGVAVPVAAWLASGSSWGRRGVEALTALPLVLPPTVLGFYLLVGLGPQTAFGRALIRLLGHPLAFSFAGLLTGSMIYSLPFAVMPLVSAFRGVDPLLRETASTLGASPLQIFRSVVLPLSRSGLVTAGVLTFCHTVGEFGVVLMLGGDIPGSTRTLSISLFDQVQEGNRVAADRTSLLLLVLSFVALLVMQFRPRRAGMPVLS